MKLLLMFLLLFGAVAEAKRSPIRIVILDSGYTKAKHPNLKLCSKNAEFDFTGTGIEDTEGHGENISGIIEDRLKGLNYCAYIIKYWDPKITYSVVIHFKVMLKIHDLKPDIVNFSSGGGESKFFENMFIDDTVNRGTLWVVAAGNNHTDLDKSCGYFPGCYDNVINVGSRNEKGEVSSFSNYGVHVKRWANGEHVTAGGVTLSGTSQATAIVTTEIVREMLGAKK